MADVKRAELVSVRLFAVEVAEQVDAAVVVEAALQMTRIQKPNDQGNPAATKSLGFRTDPIRRSGSASCWRASGERVHGEHGWTHCHGSRRMMQTIFVHSRHWRQGTRRRARRHTSWLELISCWEADGIAIVDRENNSHRACSRGATTDLSHGF